MNHRKKCFPATRTLRVFVIFTCYGCSVLAVNKTMFLPVTTVNPEFLSLGVLNSAERIVALLGVFVSKAPLLDAFLCMLKLYAFIRRFGFIKIKVETVLLPWLSMDELCFCSDTCVSLMGPTVFAEVMIYMDERVHVNVRSNTAAIVGIGDGGREIWMGRLFCLFMEQMLDR
ncbi:hypothetical protein BDB00DRAFT_932835 [Zychaea mexicana]|uniref:uncharacterized protein n=1 Tax=Zychaea mexicana TaxID=64656 RepID=UPI0022FE2153|nr:uncharacterized protein BDB00DRAFT_932835 [Zychaea mexicana]KAI9488282.1 hypothetical protein BDB00DRAFT_932835 [Zychaea mexicana]